MSSLSDPRLGREFFARPVLRVARELIGKLLVVDSKPAVVAGRIVETEAYRGPDDRAAHSFGGRRTARTEAMFGPAGHAYMFFVYGMHWQFNVVTDQPGQPCAVLIRAVEPVLGVELMAARRGIPASRRELTNGPGKLCQAMGLDGRLYGSDLTEGHVTLRDAPRRRAQRSPRIGIDHAGVWAARPWRFVDPESRYVSRRPAPSRRAPQTSGLAGNGG